MEVAKENKEINITDNKTLLICRTHNIYRPEYKYWQSKLHAYIEISNLTKQIEENPFEEIIRNEQTNFKQKMINPFQEIKSNSIDKLIKKKDICLKKKLVVIIS